MWCLTLCACVNKWVRACTRVVCVCPDLSASTRQHLDVDDIAHVTLRTTWTELRGLVNGSVRTPVAHPVLFDSNWPCLESLLNANVLSCPLTQIEHFVLFELMPQSEGIFRIAALFLSAHTSRSLPPAPRHTRRAQVHTQKIEPKNQMSCSKNSCQKKPVHSGPTPSNASFLRSASGDAGSVRFARSGRFVSEVRTTREVFDAHIEHTHLFFNNPRQT